MHTVFHFFHLSLLVLVSLVRGRLLWVHSIAQEINVVLLLHLSSAIHPETFLPSITFVSRCRHTSEDACNTLLVAFQFRQVDTRPKSCGRWVLIFQLFFNKENLKKRLFLELSSERIFDFMVLIIFLRNHSRIKHKDTEIVPLSVAPQRSSLV